MFIYLHVIYICDVKMNKSEFVKKANKIFDEGFSAIVITTNGSWEITEYVIEDDKIIFFYVDEKIKKMPISEIKDVKEA